MATSAKKIVLKPAPLQSKSGQFQGQIIVLPSSFIQQVDPGSSNSIRISNGSTLKISKPAAASTATSIVVPAQAAGSKRPMVYDSGSANAGQPARKRANLDHMSPEEKLMRRKLKNRVAAQNARDKKRLRMDEIEVKLQELEEANAKLQMENESLRALNERLMSSQRSTTTPTDYPNTTFSSSSHSMTPPHSDYYSDSASSCGSSSSCDRAASPTGSVLSSSSSSSADCSLVDSRSFDSAEIINASQQKSQDRGWAGLWTAVMATMAPAAFCLAASAVASSSNPSQPTSLSLNSCSAEEDTKKRQLHQSATVLPLKKRQLQAVAETPPP